MQLFRRSIRNFIEVVIKLCGSFHFCVGAKSDNRSFCPKIAFFDHPDILLVTFKHVSVSLPFRKHKLRRVRAKI